MTFRHIPKFEYLSAFCSINLPILLYLLFIPPTILFKMFSAIPLHDVPQRQREQLD